MEKLEVKRIPLTKQFEAICLADYEAILHFREIQDIISSSIETNDKLNLIQESICQFYIDRQKAIEFIYKDI